MKVSKTKEELKFMRKWKTNLDMLSTLNLPVVSNPYDSRMKKDIVISHSDAHRPAPKHMFADEQDEDDSHDEVKVQTKVEIKHPKINKRLEKLQRDLMLLNEEETVDVYEEGPEVLVFNEGTIRDKTKIKNIKPNSNIDMVCEKGIEQFFKLTFTGWKFPLILNFNMKVVVDVYISFTALKPGPKTFDYAHLKQAVIKQDWPTKEQRAMYSSMNICIFPRCSFYTTLSTKFDGKDFSNFKRSIMNPREFHIDYREMKRFSNDYMANKMYLDDLKEQRISKTSRLGNYGSSSLLESRQNAETTNQLIAKYYNDYKLQNREIFHVVMEKKRDMAQFKSKVIKQHKVMMINEKVKMKYIAQEENNRIIDLTLSVIKKKTQIKLMITNLYLFNVLEHIWLEFTDKPAQAKIRFEKAIAPSAKIFSQWASSYCHFNNFSIQCEKFIRVSTRIIHRLKTYVRSRKRSIEELGLQWERELQKIGQMGKEKKINDISNIPLKSIFKDKKERDHLLLFVYDYLLYEHMQAHLMDDDSRINYDRFFDQSRKSRHFKHLEFMRRVYKDHISRKNSPPRRQSNLFVTNESTRTQLKQNQTNESPRNNSQRRISFKKINQKIPKFSPFVPDEQMRLLVFSYAEIDPRISFNNILANSQQPNPPKSKK